MPMPRELVLIRHGESEGNVANNAARHGDTSLFTDDYMTTPGHRWHLTPTGQTQAACIGQWITTEFLTPTGNLFDRHYCSPFVRTRETAALLDLRDPHTGESPTWWLNRALRERDWGDIGSIPRNEFTNRPEYELNARTKATNPLYWTPPGGESIAHVAENRVRNICDTLQREAAGARVLAVTHGELALAFRLNLERLSDEEYEALDADPSGHLRNAGALHYSTTGPNPDHPHHQHLRWVRMAYPVPVHDGNKTTRNAPDPGWVVQVTDWKPIHFPTYTNATLAP
jgi:broad specificity phosphatase PhoE